MMRIPIRLPSKKYIDKSTLDKYIREREASKEAIVDPFTRLAFTSTHKPIIDEELKSRIDKFLFENRSARLKSPQKMVVTRKETIEPILEEYTQRRSKRLKVDDVNQEKTVFQCDLCLNKKECSSTSISSSVVAFYQLEICKHVFCRNCLLVIKNICSKCKLTFKNSQVTNIDKAFNK